MVVVRVPEAPIRKQHRIASGHRSASAERTHQGSATWHGGGGWGGGGWHRAQQPPKSAADEKGRRRPAAAQPQLLPDNPRFCFPGIACMSHVAQRKGDSTTKESVVGLPWHVGTEMTRTHAPTPARTRPPARARPDGDMGGLGYQIECPHVEHSPDHCAAARRPHQPVRLRQAVAGRRGEGGAGRGHGQGRANR